MRSLAISAILLLGVALGANAQPVRVDEPIRKARAVAAAADARLATQTANQDSVPSPDSVRVARTAAAPKKGDQKAPVPTGKAPPVAPKAAAKTVTDSTTRSVTPPTGQQSPTVESAPAGSPATTSVGSAGARGPDLSIHREVFQYDAGGRRDPFVSLLSTSDLRPLFSDLLLVVINYDPQGRNSVAIMRDATTKEQYRVRQGQLIGRMRVAAIEPKRVMFTIDEFGFSRQEALVIGDTTKVRKQ
jgi:hypothetical protein